MSTPLLAGQARCPACGAQLADEQNWCLSCGAAARTRIAPTPRWGGATLAVALAVLLSLAAIGFGIARLLRSDTATTPPPTTVTQTIAAPPAPAAPSASIPVPAPATGTTGSTVVKKK